MIRIDELDNFTEPGHWKTENTVDTFLDSNFSSSVESFGEFSQSILGSFSFSNRCIINVFKKSSVAAFQLGAVVGNILNHSISISDVLNVDIGSVDIDQLLIEVVDENILCFTFQEEKTSVFNFTPEY